MQQQPSYGGVVRADNDYALAWVRQYGLGRVFYCGFAHHPSVFWDPKMLEFYLAATQFALGDLPAPTTPSAKLTPAIRAQEQLGWQLALMASDPDGLSFLELVDKAAGEGLLYVGGSGRQKIGGDIAKDFDDRLSDDELRQIRLRLDAAGVRLATYREGRSNGAGEFARRMGAVLASSADVVSLDEAARADRIDPFLQDVRRQHPGPIVFTIESKNGLTQSIEAFNQASMRLANGDRS